MYKEAQKVIFDKAENLKDKQSFWFMHHWLYLKAYVQWFYREPAKGLQNTLIERKVVDIELIVGDS